MNVGMMWVDSDARRSLEEKILRAADYYCEKYGRFPELCLVNQAVLREETQVGRIRVQSAKNVMPNYFWLGMAGA